MNAAELADLRSIRLHRVWTPAEIARMGSAWDDGVPLKQIAARFRTSPEEVKRLVGPRVRP
jgi:hypothetical protein